MEETLWRYRIRLQAADISEEKQKARSYNERLKEQDTQIFSVYPHILDISDGILGELHIPKINTILPIYHGTQETVLSKGIGHMPDSAFPVGGQGNHTVLTGHTGYPGAELLTRLTELETGDRFSLLVLDETLTYRVDQIRIVLPDRIDIGKPLGEAEYCTLVTCTPYGVNSHRLLVRGIREKANGKGSPGTGEPSQ